MLLKGQKVDAFIGNRLDKFLISEFPNISRAKLQKYLKSDYVLVNGSKKKSGYVLKENDQIDIKDFPGDENDFFYQDLNIKIIDETPDYMVVFKPSGMITHPDSNYKENSLLNGLLNKINVSEFENNIRPGIVHRLDKDTSGLLLVAKTKPAYDFFVEEFKKRKVHKRYKALVFGMMTVKDGIIDSPIIRDPHNKQKMSVSTLTTAKNAITKFSVEEEFIFDKKRFTLLDIDLLTGRTHQIRVHFSAIDYPIIGDYLYGNITINRFFKERFDFNRHFLEAYKLEFRDFPSLELKSYEFPLSEDLLGLLDKLSEE